LSGDPSRIRTCNPRSRNPLIDDCYHFATQLPSKNKYVTILTAFGTDKNLNQIKRLHPRSNMCLNSKTGAQCLHGFPQKRRAQPTPGSLAARPANQFDGELLAEILLAQ
jgi:hypothetical protein